jgi:hypothetical protein
VAQGKLAASGRLNELLAFELQGWELVMSGVPAALHAQLASRFAKVTPLSHGRVAVTLAADAAPDRIMAALSADGARIESLNPIRHTLEDLFMQRVRESQPRDMGA